MAGKGRLAGHKVPAVARQVGDQDYPGGYLVSGCVDGEWGLSVGEADSLGAVGVGWLGSHRCRPGQPKSRQSECDDTSIVGLAVDDMEKRSDFRATVLPPGAGRTVAAGRATVRPER
jgi:hypothetical protein